VARESAEILVARARARVAQAVGAWAGLEMELIRLVEEKCEWAMRR
jgi:hypothetical protein